MSVERAGSSGATAIKYATSDGSGVEGVDYTGATGTLNWTDGDASVKKFYVSVSAKAAGGKTFKVALAPAKDNATLASPKVATVTITAPAEPLPAGAEEAGYRTKTFGPELKMGQNWFDMTFFGWRGIGGKTNSDGTVTIPGTGTGTISTATMDLTKPHLWKGLAFGGGAYIEAEFTFTNASTKKLWPRWPSFWANDIENMAANEVSEQTQWHGQPEGYGNWIETDFFEFDRADPGSYGIQIHNWFGYHGHNKNYGVHAYKDAVKVPKGFKWTDKHKYGFLWVPATATSHGYAQAYLDDEPVLPPTHWSKYDPKLPPNPLIGTSAFSVIDSRHLALILDTGPNNPMTIHTVTVWQKNKDQNITQ